MLSKEASKCGRLDGEYNCWMTV